MENLAFVIGVIGNILSGLVFLSPVGTFRRIVKNGSTEDFDSLPYICTLLNASLWTYYGIIKPGSYLVSTVNGFGVIVETIYIALFLQFAHPKMRNKTLILAGVLNLGILAAILLPGQFLLNGQMRINIIGFLTAGLTIIMYSSPFGVVKTVVTTKSVEYMPFFLSFFLFLNGGAWTLYSLLVTDWFVGVIIMVKVNIFFHYGGKWVNYPELFYEKRWVHHWKGYDPDLISFFDLVNEFKEKLGFLSVQQLIVVGPSGRYFKIEGDDGVRTLLSFVSTVYYVIHLFATGEYDVAIDVPNIVLHDGSFLQSVLVAEYGTDCSDSDSDTRDGLICHNEIIFECPDYDSDELKAICNEHKRAVTDDLHDYMEITKGMAFKDIPEAREFCRLYALAKKVQLVVMKSDRTRLRYKCAYDGCPFVVLISGDDTTSGVSVKTLVDHSSECDIVFDNSLVDSYTIAKYFKEKLQNNPKYKVKDMRDDLQRVFKLNASLGKCKRAKRMVLEFLNGSFNDGYKKLEAYANELRESNPDSDIVINLSKDALAQGKRKFLRMYICFNALKMGFKAGLRPFIGLDGTFLKGKAKGQLLAAVGLDGMNQFYPIAWAVVDKETTRTWSWFLKHLQHSLDLHNGEGFTFISDMQKGLTAAIKDVLPEAHQRYCVRHIEANWCKRWGKGELKKLLWWSAWSSFPEEFGDQLEQIKKVDEAASIDLVSKYNPKGWCRAYLDTVCKNQAVDNNFTESFNAWILEARYKPIIGMLEDIRIKVMKRLVEKEASALKWCTRADGSNENDETNDSNVISPSCFKLYKEYLKIAQYCNVNGSGDLGYEVTEGGDRHVVNLKEKRCTCRTWDLTGIPCPHAIKALEHKKIKPITEIHWYYSKKAALLTYKYKLEPVRGEIFWKIDPSQAMDPPEMIKLVGRPKVNRDRQKEEAVQRQGEWKQSRKGKVTKCSTCGGQDHNSRGCGKPIKRKRESQKTAKSKLPARTTRSLIDEEEGEEEDINLTAPQPTQESQCFDEVFAELFCNMPSTLDEDEEDPSLRPKTVSEDDYITRLHRRQKPQQTTTIRGISFRGDSSGVSEPTNLPVSPTGLTWKGKAAMTTNQLEAERQKLMPQRRQYK